jgi:hypothetical protein
MNETIDEIEVIDLIPAPPTSPHNSFLYRVKIDENNSFIATVISQSSTAAKEGLKNQFQNAAITYMGTSKFIMQVNS